MMLITEGFNQASEQRNIDRAERKRYMTLMIIDKVNKKKGCP